MERSMGVKGALENLDGSERCTLLIGEVAGVFWASAGLLVGDTVAGALCCGGSEGCKGCVEAVVGGVIGGGVARNWTVVGGVDGGRVLGGLCCVGGSTAVPTGVGG